ncbi:MAG: OsmC family protein [Armatimonadota bacterium]
MATLTIRARRTGACRFVVEDLSGGSIVLSGGAGLEAELIERGAGFPNEETPLAADVAPSGLRPMHALLGSILVCGALDVLAILAKQREPLVDLLIEGEGERPETVPAPFNRIRIKLRTNSAVDPRRFERAATLAYDKYCSVRESLSRDIEIEIGTQAPGHDTLN